MNRHLVFSQALADPRVAPEELQRRWRSTGAHGWIRNLLVSDPLPHLAVPVAVACETVTDASYDCGGLQRRAGEGCFLQVGVAGTGLCRLAGHERPWLPGWALVGRNDDVALAWRLPDGAPPWTVLVLQFYGAAAMAAVAAMPGGPALRPLALGHPGVTQLMSLGQRPVHHVRLSGREAAASVLDLLAGLGPAPAGLGDDLADRALAAIHLDPATGVAALATALGISREHLSRTVRARLGIDVRQLIARERLALAERLAASGLPAKAVAQRCGFASAACLVRARTRQAIR